MKVKKKLTVVLWFSVNTQYPQYEQTKQPPTKQFTNYTSPPPSADRPLTAILFGVWRWMDWWLALEWRANKMRKYCQKNNNQHNRHTNPSAAEASTSCATGEVADAVWVTHSVLVLWLGAWRLLWLNSSTSMKFKRKDNKLYAIEGPQISLWVRFGQQVPSYFGIWRLAFL